MKRIFNLRKCLLGLLFLVGLSAAQARATESITIGFGASIPPYVMQDPQRGIVLEVVREALAVQNLQLKTKFIYGQGLLNNLQAGWIVGLVTSDQFDLENRLHRPIYYSKPLVPYQNGAITLQSPKRNIRSIEDLAGLRVVGFVNAAAVLGAPFKALMQDNPNYREVADQTAQVIALYRNQADVVVADQRIFEHFQRHVRQHRGFYQAVSFTPLFEQSNWIVAFVDRKVRDRFNQGLDRLKRSGRLQQLLEQHDLVLTQGGAPDEA